MSAKPKVGWIGLGAMGSGMASQLCKQSFPVTAFDVWAPSLEGAVKAGAQPAKSPADAARGVRVLALMPVNKDQVEDVLFGSGGVAEVLEQGASIVCFSTVPPSYLVSVQERLDLLGKGNGIVDSPVSGGSTRAAAGTLAIMVSGSPSAVETARPVIAALTQAPEGQMSVVGDKVGAASDFKCINQVLCAIQIGMASESMAFAKALGMNPRLVYNAIHSAGSSGDSFMYGHRVPWQLRSDGIPKSAMTIIAKDIGIVMDEGRLAAFPLPLCTAAEQLYSACLGAGLQKIDDGLAIQLWDRFGIKHEFESGTLEEEQERAQELVVQPGAAARVLVVGLGVMGLGMATSLLKSGVQVVGHDIELAAMDAFTKQGGKTSSDVLEASKEAEVVLLMPNTAAQAETILFGAAGSSGVASVVPQGATIIISSTISPTSAVHLQTMLGKLDRGLEVVDAPVCGGPSRASVGDLTIFASGSPSALSKAYNTLKAMSGAGGKPQNLHFIPGGVGEGSKMKCINNHLAGVHLCAAAEAMAFAQRKGMDLQKAYEVLSKGAAASYVLVDRMPRMWQSRPPVHSAVDTFVKDLGIVLAEAKRVNCPLWFCAAAHQQFVAASGTGWGKEDDSWVSKLWEKMGITVAQD